MTRKILSNILYLLEGNIWNLSKYLGNIDYKKMKYSAYLAYLEWSNNAHILIPTSNQECSYLKKIGIMNAIKSEVSCDSDTQIYLKSADIKIPNFLGFPINLNGRLIVKLQSFAVILTLHKPL